MKKAEDRTEPVGVSGYREYLLLNGGKPWQLNPSICHKDLTAELHWRVGGCCCWINLGWFGPAKQQWIPKEQVGR